MTDPMTRLRAALDEAEQSVEYAYGDDWTPTARKGHNELRAAAAAAIDAIGDPQREDARERIIAIIRPAAIAGAGFLDGDPDSDSDFTFDGHLDLSAIADALIAGIPQVARDIADEIDAEREDTDPDALGADAYTNGLIRAAEIVRNGR